MELGEGGGAGGGKVRGYLSEQNEMKKNKINKLEIGICCKTIKEHYVMLSLIVYIQHCYREKFAKVKRVSFRKLVDCAIKELEARDSAFYPFPEEDKK